MTSDGLKLTDLHPDLCLTTYSRLPFVKAHKRTQHACLLYLNLNRFIRNREKRGMGEGDESVATEEARQACATKIAWEASLLNVNN